MGLLHSPLCYQRSTRSNPHGTPPPEEGHLPPPTEVGNLPVRFLASRPVGLPGTTELPHHDKVDAQRGGNAHVDSLLILLSGEKSGAGSSITCFARYTANYHKYLVELD
ncbi:unnamed protein product, partial [Brenthis ino]